MVIIIISCRTDASHTVYQNYQIIPVYANVKCYALYQCICLKTFCILNNMLTEVQFSVNSCITLSKVAVNMQRDQTASSLATLLAVDT